VSLIKEYESEEKEMKDLEWVKAKLKKDHKDGEVAKSQIKDGEKIDGIDLDSYWRGRQTANYIARCYLEDLDEPEVLSQEWIDKNSMTGASSWKDKRYVSVEYLENLLVPKQEKPVIPEYVADYIPSFDCPKKEILRQNLESVIKKNFNEEYTPAEKWINNNFDLFALAVILDSYEIEEEPKYEVRNNKGELLLTYYENEDRVISLQRWENELNAMAGRDWKLRHQLTEQEIKDYDDRYMAFAKPVEELEE